MQKDDLELKVRWYTDPDIRRTLILDETLEIEKTHRWFERIEHDPSRCDLLIETTDGIALGVIGLVHIDRRQQTAEIVLTIGRKDYWGKGVMYDAEVLLLAWAFSRLGLEKVWAQARADNLASLITMKKIGFQLEGTLRQHVRIDGGRFDILQMGILKEEFERKYGV